MASKYAKTLGQEGIMVGAGDFYAVRTLRALGVNPENGVLRISFVHYTRKEEVDKLISCLEKVFS